MDYMTSLVNARPVSHEGTKVKLPFPVSDNNIERCIVEIVYQLAGRPRKVGSATGVITSQIYEVFDDLNKKYYGKKVLKSNIRRFIAMEARKSLPRLRVFEVGRMAIKEMGYKAYNTHLIFPSANYLKMRDREVLKANVYSAILNGVVNREVRSRIIADAKRGDLHGINTSLVDNAIRERRTRRL